MTLADLSPSQINGIVSRAHHLKHISLPWLSPQRPGAKSSKLRMPSQSLFNKSIALLFSKRSTRTRLSAETSAALLGGKALFLGKDDIQLGANESTKDTARVIGGMCQGVFARVGDHSEIEVSTTGLVCIPHNNAERFSQELAQHSPVPVLNALSSLWHPTQVLADLLTLHEHASFFSHPEGSTENHSSNSLPQLSPLRPLTIAYVGDSANVLHDMLVTYPRLGHKLRVASPDDPRYRAPQPVWDRVLKLGCDAGIWWGTDPREAVRGADVVVTDTWYFTSSPRSDSISINCFRLTPGFPWAKNQRRK